MTLAHHRRKAIIAALLSCAAFGTAAASAQSVSTPPPIGGAPAAAPAPTASAPAAPAITAVQAVTTGISPLYGRINPFYGDVNAAYGRINPFYGRINPFYGRINPFFGDVTQFWGRINPFTQSTDSGTLAIYGNNYDPFWGTASPYKSGQAGANYAGLNGFWTGQFNAWTPILTAWNAAQTQNDAAGVAALIQNNLVTPSTNFWAPIVGKGPQGVAAVTGTIQADLANAGVTFNGDGTINPTSLLNGDPSARAMVFLNLYDDLMDNAGTGHVDWWMGAVGWTPAMALTQGKTSPSGATPTIGMIDFVVASGKNVSKQVTQYGSTVFADGHGAAVGSLILGATDGSGVMGVMPQGFGTVAVYNPYDDSGTTNWTDVGTGVQTLSNLIVKGRAVPMGVINASLGVPGWTLHPGWNDALAQAGAHGQNLVVAAGNDGITQTQDVPWDYNVNPTLLIVGSVGADGTISNFSNRPGEACLLPTSSTVCNESDKLKYRFIVAPGELILVSDGQGGHLRVSGTSLAAPLVSGAIGLLQNRWPWLANYPDETAAIILRSATPKGDNPGADAVYGVGELNIAAAQAPLNWSGLTYYPTYSGIRSVLPVSLSSVVAQLNSGTQSSWNTLGLSYTAFESIGNTYRDFQIPLSSKLVGQNTSTQAGAQAYQAFLSSALRAQAGHFAALGAGNVGTGTSLTAGNFASTTVPAGQIGGMQFRVSVTPAELGSAFRLRTQRFDTDAMLVTEKGSLQFGFGNAAPALDGSAGFAFRSDYDLGKGGANPLLGLASGGAYLGARTTIAPGLSLTIGTTDRSSLRNLASIGSSQASIGSWIDRYAAQAQTVGLAYAVNPRLTARFSYTHLDERSALLGIQSLDRSDLAGGSATEGTTAGFDLGLTRTLLLSGSATFTRTRADGGQIATRNLTSASAGLALIKNRIFGRQDQLRLTVASPLHTIGGALSYSGVGIVNRDTGEIGTVTQSFSPQSRTPVAGQAMYGMALPKGMGEFSFFGRVDRASELMTSDLLGYAGGAQLQMRF